MTSNLYLIELIYFIFYAFLILFIYFNAAAIVNFSKSNKIIVENASPQCLPDVTSLPAVTPKQCQQNPNHFIYNIEKSNLYFIVTKKQEEARYFTTICKKYCSKYNINQQKCEAKNKTTYDSCIDLLQPPPNCSNNSSAIAIDKNNSDFLYAWRNQLTPNIDPSNC